MAPTILANRLTKRYGGVTALDALDLEIETGEVFGYLGPNGAGKSTTIALLLGSDPADFGWRRGSSAWTCGATRRPSIVAWRTCRARRTCGRRSPARRSLRFLASIHGSVDSAYRDELIERFDLHARQEDPRATATATARRCC